MNVLFFGSMTKICVSSNLSPMLSVLHMVVVGGPSFKRATITFLLQSGPGTQSKVTRCAGSCTKKPQVRCSSAHWLYQHRQKGEKIFCVLSLRPPSSLQRQKHIELRAGLHQSSQRGDPGRPWAQPDSSWLCCHNLGPLASQQFSPLCAPEELKSAGEGEEGACLDSSCVPGGQRPGEGMWLGCRAAQDAARKQRQLEASVTCRTSLPSLAFGLCTFLMEMLFLSGQNNSKLRTELHAEVGSKEQDIPHDVFAHWREVSSSRLLRETC